MADPCFACGAFCAGIFQFASPRPESMELYNHSMLSVRRWGGKIEDYLEIHRLIDSTKSLCSDNRHRIFHTIWAVQEIVVPVFGEVFENSDGKQVDVKFLCERDHLLPDYHYRFIPTLGDFVRAMGDAPVTGLAQQLDKFHQDWVCSPAASSLLLSPLALTGSLKSLLITHNSWFINRILPRLGLGTPKLVDFPLFPALFFDTMRFEMWMDNGTDVPFSARSVYGMKSAWDGKLQM